MKPNPEQRETELREAFERHVEEQGGCIQYRGAFVRERNGKWEAVSEDDARIALGRVLRKACDG